MISEGAWRRRFRAARTTLPGWARDDPERLIYTSNAGGKWELYAWDRRTETHRQVTGAGKELRLLLRLRQPSR